MKRLSDELEELLLNESFLRWIQGKSYFQENDYWDTWLKEDPDREKLVSQAKTFLQLPYNSVKQPSIDAELKHLKRAIEQHTIIHRIESHRSSKRKARVQWLYKGAAAAAVACVVFVLIFITQSGKFEDDSVQKYKTLATSFGEKATLKLGDGSKIYLNAHSSLRYTQIKKVSEPMDVWLEGEAYFIVNRSPQGQKRTFSVHTNDGEVRVLGTRFAVQTYDQHTQVVLEEGSVHISVQDSTAINNKSLLLHPGEMSRFQAKDDTLVSHQVNTAVHTSWISNKIVMDETPLRNLTDRIKRTYGVDVRVEDKKMLDQKLSGSLEEYNLDILLEGLSQILEVRVNRQNELVVINATK